MYEYRVRRGLGTLRYPVKPRGGSSKAKGGSSSGAKADEGVGEGSTASDAKAGGNSGPTGPTTHAAAAATMTVGARSGAGADILKLFMSKAPKRMQAPTCWMEGVEEDDDFTAAVDAEWARLSAEAKAERKGQPPRQAAWNVVASERYKLLSEEEKAAVRQKVEDAHKVDMKQWLARKSEEPESPEDAVE